MNEFKIDAEFQALLPAQTPETRQRLEKQIDKYGCRPGALVVASIADGHDRLLVDGHNTLAICTAKSIKTCEPIVREFLTRQEAIEWMIDAQLGRRNLTDEQRQYYIGKKYLSKKPERGHHDKEKTLDKLSDDENVSTRTVERAAEFAAAIDTLKKIDPEKAIKILAGKSGLTKAQIAIDATLCERCARVGAVKDCAKCVEARAAAAKPKRKGHKKPTAPTGAENSGAPADDGKVPCTACKGTGRMTPKQAASAKFVPPTLEEVTAYCHERGDKVNPEKWMDHYTSNGWKVGKNPMKDWKAAVRTWENSEFTNGKQSKGEPHGRTAKHRFRD